VPPIRRLPCLRPRAQALESTHACRLAGRELQQLFQSALQPITRMMLRGAWSSGGQRCRANPSPPARPADVRQGFRIPWPRQSRPHRLQPSAPLQELALYGRELLVGPRQLLPRLSSFDAAHRCDGRPRTIQNSDTYRARCSLRRPNRCDLAPPDALENLLGILYNSTAPATGPWET